MCVCVCVYKKFYIYILKENSSHILVSSYNAGLLTSSLTHLVSYNLHNSFVFQLISHEDKFGNYFMLLLRGD
jgi:hypothetical protein